jgi:hypothetical protein
LKARPLSVPSGSIVGVLDSLSGPINYDKSHNCNEGLTNATRESSLMVFFNTKYQLQPGRAEIVTVDTSLPSSWCGLHSLTRQPNCVITHQGQTFQRERKLQGRNSFLFLEKNGGVEHSKCLQRPFASEVSAVAAFCVASCSTS